LLPYNKDVPFLVDATPEALEKIPGMKPDFVTQDGALRLSYHSLLVDSPNLRVVVDTCVGNDRPRQFITEVPLQTHYLKELNELGWSPDSVDVVLCTHMHVDHVGWNTRLVDDEFVPTFPNAEYLFAKTEFDHFSNLFHEEEQKVIFNDSIKPILDAGLEKFIQTDHRLSDELYLLPTPGHTPGHVSVVIESEGERAIISGDAIHHPCQMPNTHWMTAWEYDAKQALLTREKLLKDLSKTQDLLIGTHFAAPTAGKVCVENGRFIFKPVREQ
jgi:glyoxylase-like metal-dependent hydrolase (beta-lactamase superfamily II)